MNKIIILSAIVFTLLFIHSCQYEIKNTDEINAEKIPVDISIISKNNLNDIFEKIELVPLETNDNESLIGRIDQFIYVKDRYFIMRDINQQIFVFDEKGVFISNSAQMIGNGVGEYAIALYVMYNPYSEKIDVLTPFNHIFTYDMTFTYTGDIKLHINHPGKHDYGMIHFIFPISEAEYICVPPTIFEKYNTIYFYNWKEEKIKKKIVFDDTYGGITQTVNPIRYTDSIYYFNPALTTYTGYFIDIEQYTIQPAVNLDFGNKKIDKNSLKKFKAAEEIRDYLVVLKKHPIPVISLFNENYLVCRILYLKEIELYTFFINRKTKQHYLLKELTEDGYKIPEFLAIENNILFAIIHPFQLTEYIDNNLLSMETKEALLKLKEDDNPMIAKYYLK
jgi:hypothetical protein